MLNRQISGWWSRVNGVAPLLNAHMRKSYCAHLEIDLCPRQNFAGKQLRFLPNAVMQHATIILSVNALHGLRCGGKSVRLCVTKRFIQEIYESYGIILKLNFNEKNAAMLCFIKYITRMVFKTYDQYAFRT